MSSIAQGGGAPSTLSPIPEPAEAAKLVSARPAPTPHHEESDVWYGGYAGRAMTGGFLICLVLTGGGLAGAWYFQKELTAYRSEVWLAVLGVVGAAWLFQVIRWGYRVLAFHSRLTTRRLLSYQDFLCQHWRELPLTEVIRVEAPENVFRRFLGVGPICLFGEESVQPLLVLPAISHPKAVAETVRHQAAKAREAQVTSTRVTG